MQLTETLGDQFVNRLPALRIVFGAKIARGLVQDQRKRRILTEHFAIALHMIAFANTGTEIEDDLPINFDTALRDEFFNATT